MKQLLLVLVLLLPTMVLAQTISGTITDDVSGETLIGATVLDVGSGKGTVTNAYGRYSLTIKGSDSAMLRVSYIGYATQNIPIDLSANQHINIKLKPAVELEEVVIRGERMGSAKVSQMSAVEIPVEQIRLVPVLFGETDVLKAIQLLPGVQSGTEGTSGIYVRGGGPDENLFLLDGVPLYNVNHLGGFFSAFNGDAIKNVTLYKGSFPSHFAGRISSVVDITTNDGNDKEWHGGASIGLLSAKLNVEGPIIKEKTTASFSLRRTYGDLLIKPTLMLASVSAGESYNAGYYFYDLNGKITHKFSDRSKLFASIYSGDDAVYLSAKINDYEAVKDEMSLDYKWGNLATSLRWNYVINPQLFFNLTGSYTRYRNNLTAGMQFVSNYDNQPESEKFSESFNSGIYDLGVRADFDYTPMPEHNIKFGANLLHHIFTPEVTSAKLQYRGSGDPIDIDTTIGESKVRAQEMTLYGEDDWSLTEALKVNVGVALTGFLVENKFYPSVQPRLSSRYLLSDDVSIKVGYAYMTQYMHLLSNSSISLPVDLWVPVTKRIAPMNSNQVAAGVFYNWRSLIDFSVEGYYKWMDNLMEYRPGSSFFGNSANWEDKVCLGSGRAFGVEFLAQKSVGDITGWVGYTLSRSLRTFEELNDGKEFPAKYDRIHDISISLQYRPNERFDCGITWVYSSGNTATLAMQEIENPYNGSTYYDYEYSSGVGYVSSRNNFRLPAYHRMDVSMNFHKQLRRGKRTINISIYNLYNQKNPFIVYKSSKYSYQASDGTLYGSALVQLSLFPILPSISYIYKF